MFPKDKATITIFSSLSWKYQKQKQQHLSEWLSFHGYDVIYFTGIRSFILDFISKVKRDETRSFNSRINQINENLWVMTPPISLPFKRTIKVISRINNILIKKWVAKTLNGRVNGKLIFWVFDPEWYPYIKDYPNDYLIFDCVKDYELMSKYYADLELLLLRRSDLVLVTNKMMFKKKKRMAKKIKEIPLGVNLDFFSSCKQRNNIPIDMRDVPKPIIGFIGGIHKHLDFNLIRYLSIERPNWSFVFVGDIDKNIKIDKLPQNVYFLGYRSYELVPSYLNSFNICISPNRPTEFISINIPTKLYEYLSSGKPIVSTYTPVLETFSTVIYLAKTNSEFLRLIDKALVVMDNVDLIRKRKEYVANFYWDRIFTTTMKSIPL